MGTECWRCCCYSYRPLLHLDERRRREKRANRFDKGGGGGGGGGKRQQTQMSYSLARDPYSYETDKAELTVRPSLGNTRHQLAPHKRVMHASPARSPRFRPN